MSPLLSLLLAAGIFVVGTAAVLAWHRWNAARQEDGIANFAREMRALAPERPIDPDGSVGDRPPASPGSADGGPAAGPPGAGGTTPGA